MSNTYSPVKVITHCDTFHCDEVTATAMLKYLYGITDIIRTRDTEKINKEHTSNPKIGSFVIDVGKQYNPSKNLFDHHQKGCNKTFDNSYKILLSSCGMIWKHCGKNIINKMASIEFPDKSLFVDTEEVFNQFYKYFVVGIDANDTGTSQFDTKNQKIKLNYSNSLSLSYLISKCNGEDPYNHDEQMINFKQAVNLSHTHFTNTLHKMISTSIEYSSDEPKFRFDFDARSNPEILIVPKRYTCMNKYLSKYDPYQTIKFILVPRGDNETQIWTIEKKGERFNQLVKIISEKDAKELLNNNDVVFVHKTGFTGSFKTSYSAYKVCLESLNVHYNSFNIMNYVPKNIMSNIYMTVTDPKVTTIIAFGLGVYIGYKVRGMSCIKIKYTNTYAPPYRQH